MSPVLASTRAELADLLAARRARGETVGLVPTMGALHEGHASLMRVARETIGPGVPLVTSIFINPLQFGPNEDLDRYPRTLDADLEICAVEGVDVVFAPSVDEVYPGGPPQVTVEPGTLATILEGRTRPGHFAGVLMVVAKMFGLVRPDVAVFGQKDYQQLALIRRMTQDLCLAVEVVGAPTVREPDGLALSSRNRFLDADQRRQAVALHRALRAAQAAAVDGVEAALLAGREELARWPGVEVDYLAITDPALAELPGPADQADLPGPPDGVRRGTEARALVAARLGPTRLIDNLALVVGAVDEGEVVPHEMPLPGDDPPAFREGLPPGHPQEGSR